MYDIIIIGAGPAGLTSALYALRANKKVLILERKSYGGQIVNAHEVLNYPGILSISGFDLATNLYNQVKNLNGTIKYEEVIKVTKDRKVITRENEYQAKSVIIATGAVNRKLNLSNEKDFIGKGVSYCATCDGNFYKNKVVAVNGGGNNALEEALYLADIAQKVYLIHRRDNFSAEDKYIQQLNDKKNVEVILNTKVTSLNGCDRLESITIESDNNKKDLEVQGLFIAIGQVPQNEIFKDVVEIDDKGYIKAVDDVCTKTFGIYVAGDARAKLLRQLTTAVSDGSLAATVAIKEMEKQDTNY